MKYPMAKCTFNVILLAAASTGAWADINQYTFEVEADGRRRLVVADSSTDLGPATGTRSYDNWRDPTATPPGQSFLTRTLALGAIEYGDDLQLANWTPGKVNDIGWTFYNSSTTSRITSFGATIRFYDSGLNLLGVDSAIYFGQTWNPGARALTYTNGGAYRNMNIYTRESMFMSVSFFSVVGGLDSDMGVLYGGPITFGNSSRFARNMTTGDLIDLGASPQANLGFFIDTVVPAPAAASLLAASSLLALRRRRTTKAEC